MADIDLNFLARQNAQIISDVGMLRDENRVLTAICTRLESAQPAMVVELRALQSLIGRLDERFRKLETDGMLQVDAIANQLGPRLQAGLVKTLFPMLQEHIEQRLIKIQEQLAGLHSDYSRGDAGGEGGR